MGCNCKKNDIPLSLKQKIRQETKKRFAEVRRLWKESGDVVISSKDELGFKPKE